MIRTTSSLVFGLAALCAVAGAQTPTAELVGKWSFKDLQAPAALTASQLEMAKKNLSATTVQFGKDSSFELNSGMQKITGKWSISGRSITIKPVMMNGQTVEQLKAQLSSKAAGNPQMAAQIQHISDPLKATLSNDGRTVTLMASAGKTGSVSFKKAG